VIAEEKKGNRDRDKNRGNRKERGGFEYSRFFFNMGKKNGIKKRTIIDLINQQMPGKNVEIGNIEVLKGFSFFEVDKKYEKEMLKNFKNAKFKGQRIGIDIANKK